MSFNEKKIAKKLNDSLLSELERNNSNLLDDMNEIKKSIEHNDEFKDLLEIIKLLIYNLKIERNEEKDTNLGMNSLYDKIKANNKDNFYDPFSPYDKSMERLFLY
jgi:hypothetical protein